MATDKTAALEILRQLGGNQFLAMTGCKALAYAEDEITFSIPARMGGEKYARNGATRMRVTLDASDTYTVTFGKIAKREFKVIDESAGLYCAQIRGHFERQTGLDTSLTQRFA